MRKPSSILISIALTAFVVMWFASLFESGHVKAQTERTELFRVGERLTYNISLDRFPNVAFAETHVVSKGKVNGKDAIEIQSRLKTLNFITVDFFLVDASRTAFVSPVDGNPIFVKNTDNSTGAPIETVTNFAEKGVGVFDLSTIIYKIRASNGSGSFEMLENDKRYGVTFHMIGNETVSSDAGDFPANIIEVQSGFLTDHGITNLKISITSDGSSIPVQFRAKTAKGEFRAVIASIQVAAPEATPMPTLAVVQTPRPTPKPSATPSYIDNQPLVGMPFELGETLDYTVTTVGRSVGVVTLSAKERKRVNDRDSLLLSVLVSNAAAPELFRLGNGIRSNVSPDTLAPYDMEMRFDGPLAGFNQFARFDQATSKVSVNGTNSIDIPVGTHNILSLIYAIRQFNLTLSKDASNPINDTRVAVFWQGKTSVFTLRPLLPQTITIGERKITAQKIAVNTGNPQLDALGLSVWLSNDIRRIPLRYTIGSYQLDLIVKDIEFQP